MASASKTQLGLAVGLLFLATGTCLASAFVHRATILALLGAPVDAAGPRSVDRDEPPTPTPVPMPAERPGTRPLLIGEDAVDEHGYPRQRPDATALVDLLRFGELDTLTDTIESWQRAFEADFRKEPWVAQGVGAFGVVDPTLEPLLDRWVATHPSSWVPWAARAAHRIELGIFERGDRSARETSARRFEAMTEAFAAARSDLEQALGRARHVVAVHDLAARLAIFASDDALLARSLASAKRNCRACVGPRAFELMSLEPRWGGSFEQMEAAIAEAMAIAGEAPALRALGGHVDYYRCFQRHLDDDEAGALALCTSALEHGRRAGYHELRARVLSALERYEEALAEMVLAIELDPNVPELWALRGDLEFRLEAKTGRPCDKPRSYHRALRLDAASPKANRGRGHAAEVGAWAVPHLGRELGRRREAFECARVTAQIDLDGRRAAAVLSEGAEQLAAELLADPGAEARLRERLAGAPDDFDAVIELDTILHARRELEPILGLWDAYIAVVPDDARAFRERSGAHFNVGHPAEAAADLDRACALHDPSACRERAVLVPVFQRRGWPVPAGWASQGP